MPEPSFKRTCMILGRQIGCTRASHVLHTTARFAERGDPVGKASISENGKTDQMTYRLSRLNDIPFDYCRAAYVDSGEYGQGAEDDLALCT